MTHIEDLLGAFRPHSRRAHHIPDADPAELVVPGTTTADKQNSIDGENAQQPIEDQAREEAPAEGV